MKKPIIASQLSELGISSDHATSLVKQVNFYLQNFPNDEAWQRISKELLSSSLPFAIHLFLFKTLFPHWAHEPESAPAWLPEKEFINKTNLAQCMAKVKIHHYREFHSWSINHYEKFWDFVIKQLHIIFKKQPNKLCDLTDGVESPKWLVGAKLNIIDSCFNASPTKTALIFQEKNSLQKMSFAELNRLTNRIANSLIDAGFIAGDAIAIDMPMNHYAIAIYLGIIKMGGVVVSIADSFPSDEIATRLRLARAVGIFTQDYILRDSKKLPLYEKITAANSPRAIVLPSQDSMALTLRQGDISWENFLGDKEDFNSLPVDPMTHCNILFSSGTTGEPKTIPWNHTTPIKVASDAYFHQNIQPDDVLAWPTNLGWMMGPWLIFAALINQATIAIYEGAPKDREFGLFIQNAKVTMLGVVPTLVATWRQSHCMEGLDWHAIKVFSSTGECSNPEDMLYLMSLANYKPVIEYCGGTEIGGAYITSTVLENNYPSVFTTPALGLNFLLLDENSQPSNEGEVAIIPPSIGLSTELLNADHHRVYFDEMPELPNGKKLRRHGDQLRRFANGYYCILGRSDDSMNLGAIKVSSVEIERVLTGIKDIIETAAIGVTPTGHGPSQLVIYAATHKTLDPNTVKTLMQQKINQHLNPLFKIHDVVFVSELPKTASNKIMRRILRKQYK